MHAHTGDGFLGTEYLCSVPCGWVSWRDILAMLYGFCAVFSQGTLVAIVSVDHNGTYMFARCQLLVLPRDHMIHRSQMFFWPCCVAFALCFPEIDTQTADPVGPDIVYSPFVPVSYYSLVTFNYSEIQRNTAKYGEIQ
ncbi:hypothetical protein DFH08DRAFT_826396 [Mycena albidolilacea]|uniref:Uncharacterized protein n=1 Tax=Mycena albidolilacea TaxID=1033008 RepID=A0AAD7E874_9AGAR|nr:hypothetical protein DFH08DRAFT_826396 [Mycena albidolilacea]